MDTVYGLFAAPGVVDSAFRVPPSLPLSPTWLDSDAGGEESGRPQLLLRPSTSTSTSTWLETCWKLGPHFCAVNVVISTQCSMSASCPNGDDFPSWKLAGILGASGLRLLLKSVSGMTERPSCRRVL